MTTTADEQYRPGFEAWAKSKGRDITRVFGGGFFAADDYANPRTEEAWKIWLASKRDTSTEPSAIRQAALAEAGKAVERVLWDIENGKDGLPDEVYGAERCRDAIKALRSGGGALPDEAKDAARYRWLRNSRRSHAHVGLISDNTGKASSLSEYALDRAVDVSMSTK